MPTRHDRNHIHVVDTTERFDWQLSTNGLTADDPAAPDYTTNTHQTLTTVM